MPKRLPPYCEGWRDRHGKYRVYFRRSKGPRTPLPGAVGSDEFLAAYNSALARKVFESTTSRRGEQRSVASLITAYLRSGSYRALRSSTRAGYLSRLEILRQAHGQRSVAGMTREGIVTKILQPYADRPGQALAILKMLRVLIRHAIDLGWLDHDPSLGIKRPKSGEIRAWSEQEIQRFEKFWPIGTKQRLAFALMLYTGQRRSDVHRMTWQNISGGSIRVIQQKTGERLTIPLHSGLQEVLATADRDHITILNTAYGRPFSVDGFSQFFRAAISKAGLPVECQPHGLRKAAGRRLADAGCSAHEIMAVLGHKTLAEAERYTREADRQRLASAAIAKLEGRKENGTPKPDHSGLGKRRKRKESQGVRKPLALPRGLEPLFSP
jgi:enterobacteria phage integrase